MNSQVTGPDAAAPRLRVLISAAACGPCEEPEASAGWAFAVAAARRHDVWVITRPRFREQMEAALAEDPVLARHLRVEYLDLPAWVIAMRRRSWDLYWYYALWQRALTRLARRLHRDVGFDVAHHVTFANDWLPCGVARLHEVPLVWGPVGGASRFDFVRMRRWLGRRGLVGEVARALSTGIARRRWGDPAARRARVVVAQNDDVAARFASSRRVVVEPNAALDPPRARPARPSGPPTALFVGRLIGWKGARLALATIAHPLAASWHLHVYGDGYDRELLERLADQLEIADRVTFLGHRPRQEVLAAYEEADALLFPSMHDQAGWVVGEASQAGCPVVCLPLGGPPILAGPNGFVASLEGDVVRNLAEQLVLAGEQGGQVHARWSRDRLSELVDDWYADAVGATASAPRGSSHPEQ